VTRFMEDSLDMPLSEVLQHIQDRIMTRTTYFGIQALKSPTDFWVYQEIIFETRPDVIVEIGNNRGGSTLALAHLCDLLGRGRVIGVDLSHLKVPEEVRQHPRITLVEGDACGSVERVARLISSNETVLLIEDSAHTFENTLSVLRTYSRIVKPGGYFIVEDTICHHGVEVGPKPGPYEAVETFVEENPEFEVDRDRESFLITWNPKGYLRRKTGRVIEASGPTAQPIGDTSGRATPGEIVRLFIPPVFGVLARKLRRLVVRGSGASGNQ
jgi:cephalosporin hydroxylase